MKVKKYVSPYIEIIYLEGDKIFTVSGNTRTEIGYEGEAQVGTCAEGDQTLCGYDGDTCYRQYA